jgi:6-phosphogluconolactonase
MTLPRPPFGELRLVEDVGAAFSDIVVGRQASSPDGVLRIALSGGDTARHCYEALAAAPLEWGGIEVFLGDERCVDPDDPAANRRLIREALGERFDQLGAFHPMSCDDPDGYAKLLDDGPPLDIVHLGLGPDAHTASLFPGSPALVAPAGATVVRNADPTGHNPFPRLTLTFEGIARSRLVLFTVAGASKAPALHRVCAGEDVPAAGVRAAEVLWLCDSEALGKASGG